MNAAAWATFTMVFVEAGVLDDSGAVPDTPAQAAAAATAPQPNLGAEHR